MRRTLALVAVVSLAAAARAQDAPRWPKEAEERYESARQLMQSGKRRDAQRLFHEVAEWPSGGAFRERALALYMSAMMLDQEGDPGARAEYELVVRRFPASDRAQLARERIDVLSRDRAEDTALEAALAKGFDDIGNARLALKRGDVDEARRLSLDVIAVMAPALDKAPDHPHAARAACLVGQAELILRRDSSAARRFRQSLALAEKEVARTGSPSAKGDVGMAEYWLKVSRGEVQDEDLEEGERYVARGRVALGAEVALAGLALAALATRPWRRATRATARLALLGSLAAIALSVGGGFVVAFVPAISGDQERPLAPWEGAVLAAPAIAGGLVALALGTGLGPRRAATALAGSGGALAALATAVVVIHRLDLMVVFGL